jgi:hypothetical protein
MLYRFYDGVVNLTLSNVIASAAVFLGITAVGFFIWLTVKVNRYDDYRNGVFGQETQTDSKGAMNVYAPTHNTFISVGQIVVNHHHWHGMPFRNRRQERAQGMLTSSVGRAINGHPVITGEIVRRKDRVR